MDTQRGIYGQTVPTKIMPPRLQDVLERKRCFHVIDAAIAKPIVWITAPAGAGKTALVASYFNAMRVPALWYRIDERDIDASFFFSYMRNAIKAHNPEADVPEFVSDNFKDINSFTLLFFERLFELLPAPCALVFDDYHD
ncbi:MAG: hypothetical protein L7F77_08035, partial [Candidatus Magnetominusculus sp. LBB02]|nr:hypothetical protein [Candidatus Magnetominusculus sp. LBB02]